MLICSNYDSTATCEQIIRTIVDSNLFSNKHANPLVILLYTFIIQSVSEELLSDRPR